MGMLATAADHISIYSLDKDLKTIPCRQWDFKKNKFVIISSVEANRFLYTQLLTGDAVDGIKGCPRIGKVKAEKALRGLIHEIDMFKECYLAYHKVYGDMSQEKLVYEMGQLRILHDTDFMALENLGTTYNPFEIFQTTKEILDGWIQEREESDNEKREKIREERKRSSKSKKQTKQK